MKKPLIALSMAIALSSLCVTPAIAGEVDPSKVPEIKQTDLKLYLTAKEAYAMKAADSKVLLIDVRTPEEIQYVGHAGEMMDANVPYVLNDTSGFDAKLKQYKVTPNSDFSSAINEIVEQKGLSKDSPIILMCRSGDRSSKGANLLVKAGYTKVYSVVDGFEGDKAKDGAHKGKRVVNGWKNSNLPWTYNMEKHQDKLYYVM